MARVPELISAEAIAGRVRELAEQIVRETPSGGELVVIVMLKGAFVFAADLLRALDACGAAPPVDFLTVSSYGSASVSRGEVAFETRPRLDLSGRDVLLVDDILDTGRSLNAVKAWLQAQGASRVRTCVLLDKPARREVDVAPDFSGFEVPNRFLVGYGLDYDERYRHLPYVGAIDLD